MPGTQAPNSTYLLTTSKLVRQGGEAEGDDPKMSATGGGRVSSSAPTPPRETKRKTSCVVA